MRTLRPGEWDIDWSFLKRCWVILRLWEKPLINHEGGCSYQANHYVSPSCFNKHGIWMEDRRELHGVGQAGIPSMWTQIWGSDSTLPPVRGNLEGKTGGEDEEVWIAAPPCRQPVKHVLQTMRPPSPLSTLAQTAYTSTNTHTHTHNSQKHEHSSPHGHSHLRDHRPNWV